MAGAHGRHSAVGRASPPLRPAARGHRAFRRRHIPLGARYGAGSPPHAGAPAFRRAHAARARDSHFSLSSLIFRKGLDLKHAVSGMLAENYHSALVDDIKANDYVFRAGRLTLHLAREFGFCYGVDRAVDYAYQTRERFPERNVFLTGEIIHN